MFRKVLPHGMLAVNREHYTEHILSQDIHVHDCEDDNE